MSRGVRDDTDKMRAREVERITREQVATEREWHKLSLDERKEALFAALKYGKANK